MIVVVDVRVVQVRLTVVVDIRVRHVRPTIDALLKTLLVSLRRLRIDGFCIFSAVSLQAT